MALLSEQFVVQMKLKTSPYKVIQKIMIRYKNNKFWGVSTSISIGSKSQPINFDQWYLTLYAFYILYHHHFQYHKLDQNLILDSRCFPSYLQNVTIRLFIALFVCWSTTKHKLVPSSPQAENPSTNVQFFFVVKDITPIRSSWYIIDNANESV